MSSLKKVDKKFQRIHRERIQPKNRRGVGFLEKKKDYKVRAKNRHDNEKALYKLREKALNKNPNEFNFHMINSKVHENGKHYEKKEEFTPEQLKLMQSQDMKYISYKRKIELERIEKLKSCLHLISIPDKPKNKKIVFVHEDDDEQEVHERIEQMKEDAEYEAELHLTGLNRQQQKMYKELKKREERASELTKILETLTQRKQSLSTKQKEGQRLSKKEETDTSKPLVCPAERNK